jgi:hypothetical protein
VYKIRYLKRLSKDQLSNLRMNDNNHVIFDYQNDFVQIQEPDYAVFLKGGWGCGKMFFIQQLMKNVKENMLKNYDIEIKPIDVSWYRVNSIDQISVQIRKALYLILNSKLAKQLKKVTSHFWECRPEIRFK